MYTSLGSVCWRIRLLSLVRTSSLAGHLIGPVYAQQAHLMVIGNYIGIMKRRSSEIKASPTMRCVPDSTRRPEEAAGASETTSRNSSMLSVSVQQTRGRHRPAPLHPHHVPRACGRPAPPMQMQLALPRQSVIPNRSVRYFSFSINSVSQKIGIDRFLRKISTKKIWFWYFRFVSGIYRKIPN